MDEKKLHSFLTIIKKGSINKAAEELGYTQSALSQMVQSMEQELDGKLVVRTPGGVTLTGYGAALLPHMEEALHSLHRLEEYAKSLHNKKWSVKIATQPSFSTGALPKLLQAFRKEEDNIAFEIQIGLDEIEDWLESGKIDIAICEQHDSLKNYPWIPLWRDPFCVVVPKSMEGDFHGKVSVKDLYRYPFIWQRCYDWGSLIDPDRFDSITQVNSPNDDGVLMMVEQGLGTTIVARFSAPQSTDEYTVFELKEKMERRFGIYYRDISDTAVKKFVSFLKRSAKRWNEATSDTAKEKTGAS